MSRPLPRLRLNLDFMPSPAPDHPGLLVRDPYGYSDATLIIPPPLVDALEMFDGQHTDLDLREFLVRLTGSLDVSPLVDHLCGTLERAGFLEDGVYQAMKESRQREFAAAMVRSPAHAGSAYPAEADRLRETLERYMRGVGPAQQSCVGVAAPHVSLEGGWECYREAFGAAAGAGKERCFVILATSHYGEAGKFGLTRKSYATPLGVARTEALLVDRLERDGGPALVMEDYCHRFEHSAEFQVLFLQYLFGPEVSILPILVGSFAYSMLQGSLPEEDDGVGQFFEALRGLAASEGDRLFWVLGVDMAHMGRRYGDQMALRAESGLMLDVRERDLERIGMICHGDAEGFWRTVCERGDELKWCGAAPIYTFLRVHPQARGRLLRYQQWNIDEASVVTFAGMSFHEA